MKKLFLLTLLISFPLKTIAQEFGQFTDSRDGKTYKTVKIGEQVWMAENLAFKADSGCWAYFLDTNNVKKYGYLYKWGTAKNICPQSWSLPKIEDFETLYNAFGGKGNNSYEALIDIGSSGFNFFN